MNNTNNNKNFELEQKILHEGIVNALGITTDNLQIGIKGDPSIRESVFSRPKYKSIVDDILQPLEKNLTELLLNRGTYRIFIGLNSGEIRTSSVFDPMREEIHRAEKLIDNEYLDRHYPLCDYDSKIENISLIYSFVRSLKSVKNLPDYWQSIIKKRKESWQPIQRTKIIKIMNAVTHLRTQEQFYLRNISINIMQSLIRMQFNCDGTQVVKADDFQEFLSINF